MGGAAATFWRAGAFALAMIAVIQGSNRRSNATLPFAQLVTEVLAAESEVSTLIDLTHLPADILHPDMYAPADHAYLQAAEDALKAAPKWVFLFPEYNGSFPGALKLFVDALSVRDYAGIFSGKKAALIGTASGRSGNIRGIDHLGAVLMHMGTSVLPGGLPISQIDGLLTDGEVTDATTRKTLRKYLRRFLAF